MNQTDILLPPQSSTIAAEVDSLFYFILWASLLIFVIVVAGLIYFSIKYKKSDPDGKVTSGPTHNTTLELIWTILPTILVIIVFFWGFKTFMKMNIVPKDAIEIQVTGKKWIWMFEYPNGYKTLNELTVPLGQPVKLLMSSEDVIHSFFVPSFRIKMDLLPNRYTVTWFEATQKGSFDLLCTEFCGQGHSEMLGKVTVLGEDEFEEWIKTVGDEAGEDLPLEELGAKLYATKACATCHTIDGTPSVGPTLKNIFNHNVDLENGTTVLADENYLRRSIIDPQAEIVKGFPPVMPTYQGLLKAREVDALITHIKSLSE